ncbi:MAG: aldo/keto reductase [Ignavibacterium sp.]|nr:aldo/keto reductase [Ignavibacterium sp.]
MIYRDFGNTGLKVSALGFGAGQIGDYNVPEKQVEYLLNNVIDSGINLIDTARGYYASEERIGKYISHRRNEFILSTKVGYGIQGLNDWTYDIIIAGVDEALRILRTSYIDIVHLHSCSLDILKRGEVIDALHKTVDRGKVRVAAYTGENEELKFAVDSNSFGSIMTSVNICDQVDIDSSIKSAKEKGIGVIAKRPLANAPWRFAERPYDNYAETYWLRWKEMNLPEQHDWQDTFIRFSFYTDGVDSAIVGTTNIDHLKESITSIEKGPLPDDLYNLIRNSFNSDWCGEV